MKITTRITWDIDTWDVLEHEWYNYSGPVDELKKGRGGEKASAESGLDQQKKDTAEINTASGAITPFDLSLIPSTPGQLSPYAQAQYGSDLENIANTYGNLRQQGFKLLGASGFGNAPSGREASMVNTLLNNEGNAQTAAYRNALQNTLNEGLAGGSQLQSQEQIQNPVSQQNANQSGFYNLNKMGSTAGDVLTGIATAGSLAAAPFTGGASLLALPGIAKAGQGGSAAQIPATYGGSAPDTGGTSSAFYPGAAATPSPASVPSNIQLPTSGLPMAAAPAPDLSAYTPAPSATNRRGGFNNLF